MNYIIKAKNVAISQSDLSSMMSNIMTTGTTGNPNALSMFDSTGAKFQSSGLSQVSNVLTYNPTGSTNLMSLSSTGMLLNPTSGTALQIGSSYTGIGNPNYTGTNTLSDKLQFYVNSLTTPVVSVDANGQVGIGSGASSPTLPLSINDPYTGISTSTSTATNSSVLQFGVKTNATTNATTNIMSLSTLGLTLPSISTDSTTGVTAGTIGYSGTSVYLFDGTAWSAVGSGGGSSFWSTSTDTTNNPSTSGSAMSTKDISVNGVVVGRGGGSVFGNTAIGTGVLVSNTTGSSNTAIGSRAGAPLSGTQSVSGSNNTFIGYNSAPETTSQSNTITMGDSNITKFRIPGLSINALAKQLFLGVNPTTTSFSGNPAVAIGDVGTGIANSNTSGLSGLTNTLDFYVNGGKQMSLDANGNLSVTSLSVTSLSPTTLTVGAGGLSTTTLSASGTSTLTGLLSANGGITTTNLTVTGTLTAPQVAQTNLNTSGTLSVSGTSTLTGLLTANGGIKFGTTVPTTLTAGTVYYDTATNSLQMYSTNGVNAGWFRILTRKDIVAFTITNNSTWFDVCNVFTPTIVPSGVVTASSTTGCTSDGFQYTTITIPFAISNPVITATWVASSSTNWIYNNDVAQIFVTDVTTNANTTTFLLFFGETSSAIQYNKINVTVINPN